MACEDRAAMTEEHAGDLTGWYAGAARELPWRAADRSGWGVLVSEVMLQQTPVARVLPVWRHWMSRWPTPGALAVEPAGEAVRAWGRLGYPRRALRLHRCAQVISADHRGAVPASYDVLRSLPGIGDYTASAVAAFAHGARVAVLDTNVRRVYARAFDGVESPPAHVTVGERREALARVPVADPAGYSVAVMELGALVCTARTPRCAECPLRHTCAWLESGRPQGERRRRTQTYEGTDRQARGRLLACLRDTDTPVDAQRLHAAVVDAAQAERALRALLDDGLVEHAGDGRYRLPA
jgi:A/G-specific adenine glycosylase